MTLLKIARMGHPVLLRSARPVVDPASAEIGALVGNMIETMEDAAGVGLAAPQVYESRRVIIFTAPEERAGEDAPETDFAPLTTLINPEFEPIGDDIAMGLEGCLSIPGITGIVPRHARIIYRGYAPDGRPVEREATNFHARVVQHEIDHLDGILFPSRMTDLSCLSFNEELGHLMEYVAERRAGSGARQAGQEQ